MVVWVGGAVIWVGVGAGGIIATWVGVGAGGVGVGVGVGADGGVAEAASIGIR